MRVAWVMKLKPGHEAAYKQKHDDIWPEMLERMEQRGTRTFSIYRHGLTLFAYQERDEPSAPEEPTSELTRRWWKLMEPHMECNPDGSPYHEPVEEMFHFEQPRGN